MDKEKMFEIIEKAGLTWDDLEYMAARVHDDWNAQKRADGYKYGSVRDDANKINPYMVPYEELDEEVKHWDRVTVCSVLQHMPRR